MPYKNEIQMAELKEFLIAKYEEFKGQFSSNNEFYNLISVKYPFCSVSTIRRAYLGLYEKQEAIKLDLFPTSQLSFNLK